MQVSIVLVYTCMCIKYFYKYIWMQVSIVLVYTCMCRNISQ